MTALLGTFASLAVAVFLCQLGLSRHGGSEESWHSCDHERAIAEFSVAIDTPNIGLDHRPIHLVWLEL